MNSNKFTLPELSINASINFSIQRKRKQQSNIPARHQNKKSVPYSPQEMVQDPLMQTSTHFSKASLISGGSSRSRLPKLGTIQQSRSDEMIKFPLSRDGSRNNSPGFHPENLTNRPISPNELATWFYRLKKPLNPRLVASEFKDILSANERSEISTYREIYTIGISADKEVTLTDDQGYYRAATGDHIAYRYDIAFKLGEGAFGSVYKVLDIKKGSEFAIKILRKDMRFIELGRQEINMLKHIRRVDLQNNNNIVHLEEWFIFRGHLCMIFELMGRNLYEVIRGQGFPLNTVRRIAHQLLLALKLMYKQGILHCDIKPENILIVNEDPISVKLIDFGSACFKQERAYTYLQSRYYRAPEVALKTSYSTAIDMWSFGCILFELHTGLPLFPATSSQDLLNRIRSVIGSPPPEKSHEKSPSKMRSKFFEGDRKAGKLGKMLSGTDPVFVDLIEKCLKWSPSERYTPVRALGHPFIRN